MIPRSINTHGICSIGYVNILELLQEFPLPSFHISFLLPSLPLSSFLPSLCLELKLESHWCQASVLLLSSIPDYKIMSRFLKALYALIVSWLIFTQVQNINKTPISSNNVQIIFLCSFLCKFHIQKCSSLHPLASEGTCFLKKTNKKL